MAGFSFLLLNVENTIESLNKMNPVAYNRFRRSCRNAQAFCEKYRRSLNVLATNAYITLIKNNGRYVVSIGFGGISVDGGAHFEVEMTEENVPLIREAICGLFFPIVLMMNEANDLEYLARVGPFTSAIDGMKARTLYASNVDQRMVSILATKLKVSHLHAVDCGNMVADPIFQNPCIKAISLDCENTPKEANVVGMLKNKRHVMLNNYPMKKFWPDIEYIMKNWKEYVNLENFQFISPVHPTEENYEIVKLFSICTDINAHNLGIFPQVILVDGILVWNSSFRVLQHYIIELNDRMGKWAFIMLWVTQDNFYLDLTRATPTGLDYFYQILLDVVPCIPVDLSGFKEMEGRSAEDFTRYLWVIYSSYKNWYTKPIAAVPDQMEL